MLAASRRQDLWDSVPASIRIPVPVCISRQEPEADASCARWPPPVRAGRQPRYWNADRSLGDSSETGHRGLRQGTLPAPLAEALRRLALDFRVWACRFDECALSLSDATPKALDGLVTDHLPAVQR